MTGSDLLLRREVADVQAIAVARHLGCSPSTISRLERRPAVSDETAQRYLDAVAVVARERAQNRRRLARTLIRTGTAALTESVR